MDIKSFIEKTGPEESAKILGVSVSAIKHYRNGIRRVAPRNVLETCAATGWAVTPHEARPDIYPNPTDGLPSDQASAVIDSDVITPIEAGGYTRFSGGGCLYSASEQGRRHEERRQEERRERERREEERREAERRHAS